MKRIFSALFFILTFSVQLQSQALRSDTISIESYKIDLDISDLSQKTIKGHCDILLKSKMNNVSSVGLDLLKLTLDSIYIDNQKFTNWTYNDTLIQMALGNALQLGDSLQIQVYYHGQPHVDPSGWGGFYFSNDGKYAFNLGVGFQDNPHNYGRAWFPCIDDFHDRAMYDFYITTDSTKMAVCNGLLLSSTPLANGRITYHWKLHQSIPTYLASVAVGPYVAYQDTFHGIQSDVPIAIYVPSNKLSATATTFSRLKQILAAYEWAYGPYRFDRVGYVGVPFNSGAMEHAANIAIGLGYIDGSLSYESLYAHELSHMWFGDLATTNSAPEMWINEGWAVFSEGLYREILDGKEAYKDFMRSLLKSVIQTAHINDNGYLDLNTVPHDYTYGTTVYDKGATVAHSIRGYLGDSVFFPMLRAYFNQKAFQHVSNDDFRDFITAQTGVNMTSFFDAWVKEPGFVHYSIDSLRILPSSSPEYKVQIALRQKLHHKGILAQDNHVELAFMDQSWNRFDSIFQFSGTAANFVISLPFKPDFAIIDPEERLADATTDYLRIIKSTGLKNYDDALARLDVQQISDSVLFRVMHSWAKPDTLGIHFPGLSISSTHYWTVKGNFPPSFDATGRFFYSKYGLDSDLLTSSQDSLVILWRRDAGDPWHKIAFEQKGSWSAGFMYVPHLKSGEYALASWDQQYAGLQEVDLSGTSIEVYPNPAHHFIQFTFPKEDHWSLKVYDFNGRLVDAIKTKSSEYRYGIPSQFSPGSYHFVLLNQKGNIVENKLIIIQ